MAIECFLLGAKLRVLDLSEHLLCLRSLLNAIWSFKWSKLTIRLDWLKVKILSFDLLLCSRSFVLVL